jgi:hypothetical protein
MPGGVGGARASLASTRFSGSRGLRCPRPPNPLLSEDQVILVDTDQIAALPDWPSREQALLALRDSRLPFKISLIDVKAKLSDCPRLQTIPRENDNDPPFDVRWAGALLLQESDGGTAVAPLATIHPGRADELCDAWDKQSGVALRVSAPARVIRPVVRRSPRASPPARPASP